MSFYKLYGKYVSICFRVHSAAFNPGLHREADNQNMKRGPSTSVSQIGTSLRERGQSSVTAK